MKVLPVSSFKANLPKEEYNFLYTASLPDKQQIQHDAHKFSAGIGLIAAGAVVITLFNIKGKKKLPENIVEIADINKGFNRFKKFKRTADELKAKVIYPLKCAASGDKEIARSKKIKSGVIITDIDSQNLSEFTEAFVEHIHGLGINTVNIPQKFVRKNSKGQTFERMLKRNELNKMVFNEIKKAQKKFYDEGQYTVINIGDIDKLTDFKLIKSQKSNFETILENINSKTYPGVIWTGWTTKTKSVPLFFNELPIIITKLMD